MLRLSGGRRLQSPPGSTARPTPSRVRLAVMNMLQADLPGARFLDLCCGSGVMGCEALQHGAGAVVAIDRDRRMAATARANLELVAASQAATVSVLVLQQDVLRWLRQPAADEAAAFDLIYADPPYAEGMYAPMAEAIAAGSWLRPNGLLLLECSSSNVPELDAGWSVLKQKRYGTSSVLVLSRSR